MHHCSEQKNEPNVKLSNKTETKKELFRASFRLFSNINICYTISMIFFNGDRIYVYIYNILRYSKVLRYAILNKSLSDARYTETIKLT